LYWRECIIFVAFSALLSIPPIRVHGLLHRVFVAGRYCAGITLLPFYGQAWQHQLRKSSVESLAQRVVQATPVSTAKVFMQAIEDNAVIANIGNNIPDYKLTLTDTGIDNYVLIGESERRQIWVSMVINEILRRSWKSKNRNFYCSVML
jgi:glucan phosphoethanolaminetransferase (alkaline phosphatase superfamily)